MAIYTLTGGSAGAAPLPPLQCDDETKWWRDHAVGTVSGDGTISLYLTGPVYRTYYLPDLNVAIQRPGRASWTVVREHLCISSGGQDRCCIAYHDGRIFLCDKWGSQCIKARQVEEGDAINHRGWPMPYEYCKVVHSSYLLESRGELLWALVHVNHAHYYADSYHYSELDPDYHSVSRFVEGLLVSVYTPQHDVESGKLGWVKRDDRSLVDRTMFLGHPTSFAVDSALFGATSGGCAYFVIKSQLYGGIWSKSALERCRVFRYNFNDSKAELVKQLPAEWSDQACMWLTPQPFIAWTEETGERLDSLHSKAGEPQFGPYFRIYVGNLPRKVDTSQLRQFFSKHGKVGDARVMCHIKTKRSRGFGFVTIATTVDDEPAHAIAKLDGQILDGRPLRVKFADQK